MKIVLDVIKKPKAVISGAMHVFQNGTLLEMMNKNIANFAVFVIMTIFHFV